MVCSLLGFPVHGILQVRILEWVAIPSPGDLSDPGIQPVSACISCIAGRFFTCWAIGEAWWMSKTLWTYCENSHIVYDANLFLIAVLEKAMAPHSSTLAWKIPWMEEPGRLHSMGSLRVGHDWAISLSLSTFMHWRRKWQPSPVFLPRESQGQGSLVGCHLWGCAESDTTEAT